MRQVREALAYLYDFAYLQRLPVARQWEHPEGGRLSYGEHLQQQVQEAIDALGPDSDTPAAAPHVRLHSLLTLRYVKRLTVAEAAHQLGISRRQAHRDLRRAEESVATVLWARRPAPGPQAVNGELVSAEEEVALLEPQAQPLDLRDLLRRAQGAVARLAESRNTRFEARIPDMPVIVSTDPAMAQQILVNILSYAVQQAAPGSIELVLSAGPEGTSLSLGHRCVPGTASASALGAVAAELAARLGWRLDQADGPGLTRAVTLHISSSPPATILVVDDNEGLTLLLERYLAGRACHLVAAMSGAEALRLAEEVRPDAIMLDVMMPGMDGWEVLQRLRMRPQTAHTPVVICSVFNDPELAYSLGASHFLPKPARREQVLAALRQLQVI